jgi:hypothetical protein
MSNLRSAFALHNCVYRSARNIPSQWRSRFVQWSKSSSLQILKLPEDSQLSPFVDMKEHNSF